jgi:zinc D-Ala-D-Ala carboxypeptidase
MSEHFILAEFERSDIARRHGWDNRVPPGMLGAATCTMDMLERIRTLLWRERGFECPMHITSGYRCLAVNRAVGSAYSSAHNLALAADWVAPEFGTPTEICRLLAAHVDALGIGQLINEFPGGDGAGWVHTGVEIPEREINRVITIDRDASGKVATLPGVLDSFA